MKNILLILATMTAFATSANAQVVELWENGQILYSANIENVDSISFHPQLAKQLTDLGKTFVAVDLGLPSGLRWASFNIGATSPDQYGSYFAWGEIETKNLYDWSTYKHCEGSNINITKYFVYNGFTDHGYTLEPEDDVATVKLGGNWRMPTNADWDELINKCTCTWSTINGVKGCKMTGPNGNSIFLPLAGSYNSSLLYKAGGNGSYWSSSIYEVDYETAKGAYFVWNSSAMCSWSSRTIGSSVRPVCPAE